MTSLPRVATPRGPFATCWELLPHVSRTFALTIPSLSEPVRTHVAVAYLLCRIADTVEDAEGLSAEKRRRLFGCLLELMSRPLDPLERERFVALWNGRVDEHHERLMRRSGEVLLAYASLPEAARQPIRACVEEMVGSMAAAPVPQRDRPVAACPDLEALERYCHAVAGTVGILLSRLFAQEIGDSWLTAERLEEGRRFGLGLQLTNVIKDAPNDRRRGISYLPPDCCRNSRHGPILSREGARVLIGRALEHFDAAQSYVVSIPPRRSDMRIFCLWASHLALATLAMAAAAPGRPAKISRDRVHEIQAITRSRVKNDAGLADLYGTLREEVTRSLAE